MNFACRWFGFGTGNCIERFLAIAFTMASAVAGQTPERDSVRIPRCTVKEISRTELNLEGRSTYIEPLAFSSGHAGLLLAGSPSYVWPSQRTGAPEHTFGVVIPAHGRVLRVPWPIASHNVGDMRAIELRDGSWGIVFAQYTEASKFPNEVPQTLWYATFDGHAWRGLVRLPLPPTGKLDSHNMSQISRYNDSLFFGVPITRLDTPNRGAVFTLARGRWSMSEVGPTVIAYVVPAHPTSLGWQALVIRGDSTDTNAPYLYQYRQTDSTASTTTAPVLWAPLGKLSRIDRNEVQSPRFIASPTEWVISWLGIQPRGHIGDLLEIDASTSERSPVQTAHQSTGVQDGARKSPTRTIVVDTAAMGYSATTDPEGNVLLVSDHAMPSLERSDVAELRFTELGHGVPIFVGAIPNPYMDVFAVTMPSTSEVVLSGPLVRNFGTSAFSLRTLLIRLRMSCGGKWK